jgi:hypothetical protein
MKRGTRRTFAGLIKRKSLLLSRQKAERLAMHVLKERIKFPGSTAG